MVSGIWKFLKPIFSGTVLSIPVAVAFIDCVAYVAKVEGISMQPVLNPTSSSNDYVFLNKWTVKQFNMSRGDIVALKSPRDPKEKLIKRVIGLEGDTIKTLSHKERFVHIPKGHCWIEGDHHNRSMDSNQFGPISLGLITAKATHIVWPLPRFQRLKNHLPKGRDPVLRGFEEADVESMID